MQRARNHCYFYVQLIFSIMVILVVTIRMSSCPYYSFASRIPPGQVRENVGSPLVNVACRVQMSTVVCVNWFSTANERR